MMFENAREVQPLKKWMKLICERCIQKKDSDIKSHHIRKASKLNASLQKFSFGTQGERVMMKINKKLF